MAEKKGKVMLCRYWQWVEPRSDYKLTGDDCWIDMDRGVVRSEGAIYPLKNNERKVLAYLLLNGNQMVSYESILDAIWDVNLVKTYDEKAKVRVEINNLRKIHPAMEYAIQTVFGCGYSFVLPDEENADGDARGCTIFELDNFVSELIQQMEEIQDKIVRAQRDNNTMLQRGYESGLCMIVEMIEELRGELGERLRQAKQLKKSIRDMYTEVGAFVDNKEWILEVASQAELLGVFVCEAATVAEGLGHKADCVEDRRNETISFRCQKPSRVKEKRRQYE